MTAHAPSGVITASLAQRDLLLRERRDTSCHFGSLVPLPVPPALSLPTAAADSRE